MNAIESDMEISLDRNKSWSRLDHVSALSALGAYSKVREVEKMYIAITIIIKVLLCYS